MSRLGMHSREEMAKEELSHITLEKVNEQDRQKVLEYARQKDFETAKEVLSADSNGTATEERIRQQFDNNQTYSNFYQSQRYNDNKVKGFDHELYSYAQYKWEDDETAREEYFARSSLGEDDESADAQFFENYSSEIELAEEPDESFLAKQSQISDSSKITYAQKIKGAAVGIFGAAAMKNALDAHDHGYMTTAGYNASLGMKGMGKGMEALSHVPSGASVAGTAADTAGHMSPDILSAAGFGVRQQAGDRSQRPLCQLDDFAHRIFLRSTCKPVSASFSAKSGQKTSFYKKFQNRLQVFFGDFLAFCNFF